MGGSGRRLCPPHSQGKSQRDKKIALSLAKVKVWVPPSAGDGAVGLVAPRAPSGEGRGPALVGAVSTGIQSRGEPTPPGRDATAVRSHGH